MQIFYGSERSFSVIEPTSFFLRFVKFHATQDLKNTLYTVQYSFKYGARYLFVSIVHNTYCPTTKNRAIRVQGYCVLFQVAWVRVDTQTILSIHHNVITQNPRISLSYNDHRSWYLHIKNVHQADRGWYMCQVNTDPMRSRQGYLQVVGKAIPSIIALKRKHYGTLFIYNQPQNCYISVRSGVCGRSRNSMFFTFTG